MLDEYGGGNSSPSLGGGLVHQTKVTYMSLRSTLTGQAYRIVTALLGDQDHMVTLPVLSGPAKGLRIRADLVKRREAYFWGKYDRSILDRVMPYVEPGHTMWDCGTYLGFYTLVFARMVGRAGRVVAIELDSHNLERTRENAELNKLTNIDFVNVAIGAPAGFVEFVVDNAMNSHLPGTYVGGLEMQRIWRDADEHRPRKKVECISLDQALLEKRLPPPNLIKVDIEGAENDALQHASYMFEHVRPLLLLELHNLQCDRAAWDFARRFEYELKGLETGETFTSAEQVHGTLLCRPLES
jgi:FkbM family methyltransferase